MDPPLNGTGNFAAEVSEKVEILNIFLLSVFTDKASPQESLTQKIREKIWKKGDFPLFDEVQARDHLVKFDIHRFMGPGRIRPQVLGEQAHLIVMALSSLKGHGSQERGLGTGRMSPQSSKKREKDKQTSQPHLEQHVLETILIM